MHTSLAKFIDYIMDPRLEMTDELSEDPETSAETRLALIKMMTDDVAHYVVDRKLVDLVFDPKSAGKIAKSACAMIKAGIRHLPFDPILLEFDSTNGDTHCYVRLQSKPMFGVEWEKVICFDDPIHDERTIDFAAYVTCTKPDTRPDRPFAGSMLVATISPYAPLPVVLRDDTPDQPFWVVYGRSGMDGLDDDLSLAAVVAVHLALLLLNTRGIIAEHVDTSKLNKARAKGSKPKHPLKPYHVVRVGHVYDAAGKAHDVKGSGRTMPVHWRAGHVRNVRYGPYSEPAKHRPRWIEPCLVNYEEGDAPLPKKEVTL